MYRMQNPSRLRLRASLIRPVLASVSRPSARTLAGAVVTVVAGLAGWAALVGGFDQALLYVARRAGRVDVPRWVDLAANVAWMASVLGFAALSRRHSGPAADLTSVFSATSERASTRRTRDERRVDRRSAAMFVAVFATGALAWLLG